MTSNQDHFRVVVLIPAYKPDERLIELTRNLRDEKLDVLLVDDGGGAQYAPIFEQCRAVRWAPRSPCMRSIRARGVRSRPD